MALSLLVLIISLKSFVVKFTSIKPYLLISGALLFLSLGLTVDIFVLQSFFSLPFLSASFFLSFYILSQLPLWDEKWEEQLKDQSFKWEPRKGSKVKVNLYSWTPYGESYLLGKLKKKTFLQKEIKKSHIEKTLKDKEKIEAEVLSITYSDKAQVLLKLKNGKHVYVPSYLILNYES